MSNKLIHIILDNILHDKYKPEVYSVRFTSFYIRLKKFSQSVLW